MSNFAFLAADFPTVHEAAFEAERQAGVSPTAAAFFAGKAVELAVKWAFRNDPGLKLPYQDNIAALLHEPSFRRAAGEAVFAKAKFINTLRNRAVHEKRPSDPPTPPARSRSCSTSASGWRAPMRDGQAGGRAGLRHRRAVAP
jgi:type I restriction enzyme R subunit